MSKPVALILGAGPNIGAALSKTFSHAGYSVAVASRSARSFEGTSLAISGDFAKPQTAHQVFEEVRQKNWRAECCNLQRFVYSVPIFPLTS